LDLPFLYDDGLQVYNLLQELVIYSSYVPKKN